MINKKQVFIINGSASKNSSNEKLIKNLVDWTKNDFQSTIFSDLKTLPHFDPELSIDNPPKSIVDFRSDIENADGVIICTPEYIFSIPSALKNAIEWCVATIVFSDKACGLITASASGKKGHEELLLIMNTLMAKFTNETTLLIEGVKSKVDKAGQLTDVNTEKDLKKFIEAFKSLVKNVGQK